MSKTELLTYDEASRDLNIALKTRYKLSLAMDEEKSTDSEFYNKCQKEKNALNNYIHDLYYFLYCLDNIKFIKEKEPSIIKNEEKNLDNLLEYMGQIIPQNPDQRSVLLSLYGFLERYRDSPNILKKVSLSDVSRAWGNAYRNLEKNHPASHIRLIMLDNTREEDNKQNDLSFKEWFESAKLYSEKCKKAWLEYASISSPVVAKRLNEINKSAELT